MTIFLSFLIIMNGAVSLATMIFSMIRSTRRYKENICYIFLAFASALWSVSYGAMILQTEVYPAYVMRLISIVGVLLFMIFAQILTCVIGEISRKQKYYYHSVFLLAPIIFTLIMPQGTMSFQVKEWGMTYMFQIGIGATLYTLYCLWIMIDILLVLIHMLRSPSKKLKFYGKLILGVLILVFFGTILDVVLPLMGYASFPGSTISQFWGLILMYYMVMQANKTRINESNMSEYIYRSLENPVLIYDKTRTLKLMNEAGRDFFGLQSMSQMKLRIGEAFYVNEDEVFHMEESSASIDAVCVMNGITSNLAISKITDRFDEEVGYIVVVTDLSERVKALQDLENARDAADAANKAKSTFLANMSHEIRTPMNAILGFSELALQEEGCPENIKDYIADIRYSSHALLAIINEILDISKIESGKMELVCGDYYLDSVLKDVALIIQSQTDKKGLKFEMHVDDTIPGQLHGDKTRIKEILINILNNGIKYTNEGFLRFDIRNAGIQEDILDLEIRVTDSGIGIKEEDIDKIFDIFSRTDLKTNQSVEGTGLGLPITKGYIELMGGTIKVESQYGQGSTFIIHIPQKVVSRKPIRQNLSDEEGMVKKDDFSMGNLRVKNVKALVTDDNRINLKVIEKSLTHYGMDVTLVSSGQAAIDKCQEESFDIIFMDQMMPEMDGIEAMKRIRQLGADYGPGGHCRIIVLTANAIYGVKDELLGEGFDDYLGKPINYPQLERILKEIVPESDIYYE